MNSAAWVADVSTHNIWRSVRNLRINVTEKFALEQATKAQSESRSTALLFLEPQR